MSATPTLVRDGQRVLLVRHFTKNLSSPYDGIKWVKRSAKISEKDGNVVFQMDDIEAPEFWSQLAVDIAASKYFRKAGVPVTGREVSVRQMIDRVAGAISNQGVAQGYFDADTALVLKDELTYLLVHQYAAFNSPVWFNAGLAENYNARGSASGLWAVDKAGIAHEMPDAYTRPALSACFIQTVDDNLMGIADGVKREMRVFKMGGGSGANYSNLRAEGESLSGGGKSSGVMSFLGIFDAAAGAIKSGGTVRRAARMVVLNADHPDVETFVEWKVREEKKVAALVAAGYSSDFNGEAYRTVGGQNANNSVRVTDTFMNAVKTDADWSTVYRTNKKIAKTFKARSLMRKIAEAAHACADPGMQFDTTCNAWHTTPEAGRQNSTNPCQPAWATVLTPGGITTLAEVGAGDHIWSGSQWTKITKKWSTGVKPVYAFKTRAGVFHGTENHRVVQHGEKIEVSQAESIDSSVCLDNDHLELRAGLKPADVMDGLVFGDGMVHKASKNLPPLLCVGEKDKDYFKSEVQGLFVEDRLALSPLAWAVETTLSRDEVPKTYERKVPDRFKYGHIAKVRGFLRGLYSANGSVIDGKGGSRVTLKAASFDTIESVQQMLSFLGIRSYYTTNKAHPVKFENGVYECRQSYDLNVTTDRVRFQKLIGFIQADKQERLEAACQRPVTGRCKTTYEIVERESLGEEEVFDLTVEDDAHTYWTGGLLVSNCSEYSYVDNSACNLASLNLQKFVDDRGFDVEGFCHAVDVFITAMDLIVDYASYPTKEIAENSHNLRPLGLGYANLGALLMRLGLPYDSTHGRAVCGMVTSLMTARAYRRSSQLAAGVGPFKGFAFNREPMLGVIRRHSYAMVKIPPFAPAGSEALTEIYSSLNTASIENWQDAYSFGGVHGYRNGQATLLAPTGCLVPGSLVLTEHGLTRIEDLGDPAGKQWQDASFKVQTDQGPRAATKFYVNGEADVIEVTTERGFKITGTGKHQVKVVDANGVWRWRRFAEIEAGETTPLLLGGVFGEGLTVSLPQCPPSYRTNHGRGVKTPEFMSTDLAFLVGLFMAEGSLHTKGLRFSLTKADHDLIERTADVSRALFNVDPTIEDHGECVSVNLSSTQVRAWWQTAGFSKTPRLGGGKGATCAVPDAVLATNNTQVYGAFLNGLFSGDGSVSSGLPSLTNKDSVFVSDVQTMLLVLGLPFRRDVQTGGISGKPVYRLTAAGRQFGRAFMERVGFSAERKGMVVALQIGAFCRGDYIPMPQKLVDEVCPVRHEKREEAIRNMREANGLHRPLAEALAAQTGNLDLKHRLGFFYDQIKEVELAGRSQTYDISVPENVTYVANGFVSHNTIGLLMDCDTTGIEPDYALVKFKKLAGGGAFKIVNQSVGPALGHLGYRLGEVDDILKYIEQKNTIEGAPYLKPEHLAVFDCAAKNGETGQRALAPMSHLHMMAAAQPFLSGAISKTVNCPEETTVEEIEKIYITAWELGLKAVAVYREGSKICAILSGKSEKSKPAAQPIVAKLEEQLADHKANRPPERRRLPKRRKGFTQEVMIGEHKLYLRTGDYEDGKLGEVFLDMHKQGATMSAMLDSFAKLLSISIQHGVPLEEIVEKFIHTKFEPKGLVRHDPNIKVATSILDYVFRTLAIEYLGRTDLANRPIEERDQIESHAVTKAPIHLNGGQKKPVYSNKAGETCSVCGDITVRAGTCTVCVNCGSNSGCG